MKLSRRSFLKGLAAIGAVLPALPIVKPGNKSQADSLPLAEADEYHPYFVDLQWARANWTEFPGLDRLITTGHVDDDKKQQGDIPAHWF